MIYIPLERVTEVISGRTFRTSSGRRPVQLADVEVPPLGEPGGGQARRNLDALIGGEYVRIKLRAFDRGPRRIADVWREVGGRHEHVNAILWTSRN